MRNTKWKRASTGCIGMLDYSVANNIYPRVEIIPIQKLDEANKKVFAGEVKFRYVIDMSTLK